MMKDDFQKATPRPWTMRAERGIGAVPDSEIVSWRIGPGDADGRDYLGDVHCEVPRADNEHRPDDESEANARLIVRAVNVYEPMSELLRDLARHILDRPKRQEQGDAMPQTFESWAADLIVLAKDARELLGEG